MKDAGPRDGEALRWRIEQALPAFLPEARVVDLQLLTDYDNYYYSRHNRYRPLPA